MADCVIIGSGIAGYSAAVEFARRAPDVAVCMIGQESSPSYDRPPLSKRYLLDPDPRPPVLSEAPLARGTLDRRDGVAAVAIDRTARRVLTSDGETIPYGRLLIATGSRCRELALPAVRRERVHYLRTLDQAQRLRTALREARRVAVLGGGFIGLEVAAAVREIGCSVVVLERQDAVLSRSCSRETAERIVRLHERNGVTILTGQKNIIVREQPTGIVLACAAGTFEADMLVVGVGVDPNVELALAAGLRVEDGIVVDSRCATSDSAIYAAGDVARYPVTGLGITTRSESWTASSLQGAIAARNMLGEQASYDELPWFWSDQYDVTFQSIGFLERASRTYVLSGETAGKWLRFGTDPQGLLVGAEGIAAHREMSVLRRADRTKRHVPLDLLGECREETRAEGVSA